MTLISQKQFAGKMNTSQLLINQLIKLGKLPVEGKKLIMPDAERAYHLLKSGLGLASTAATPEVQVLNTGKTITIEIKVS